MADTKASRRPIVYVRGYAGATAGIDRQVDDPFYGFNLGSTHVRVGRQGDPVFYQFESPLLRLILDEGYELYVKGNQAEYLDRKEDGGVSPATVWIHRFYDVSASTWGEKPEEFRLERAAEDLLTLIETLQRKTGAVTVDLIAHSMGGLICRSLIQKIIPDKYGGERRATDIVGRLFTYGTPHGGIEFAVGGGMIERLRDAFGAAGSDVFGPGRMYEYLTPERARQADGPPEGWKPQEMPDDDNFPLANMLCLIGTDPEDYQAARGLSAKAVGAKSDGLVQIENAYVPGANHAFVHRSHSGRYGLVNSEEGYQNLWRFLFGDVKVTADLVHLRIPQGEEVLWQAEVRLSVRGLPILMHEQSAAHACPIQLVTPSDDDADRPVPLVTTFLSTGGSRPEGADSMRYSLHVRVLSLRQEGGMFRFFDHLEQSADFDDILVVDVKPQPDAPPMAWATWNSAIPCAIRDYQPQGEPLGDENPDAGVWEAHVPLPEAARAFLGDDAAVFLVVGAR